MAEIPENYYKILGVDTKVPVGQLAYTVRVIYIYSNHPSAFVYRLPQRSCLPLSKLQSIGWEFMLWMKYRKSNTSSFEPVIARFSMSAALMSSVISQ
jgi:hypothetical protein